MMGKENDFAMKKDSLDHYLVNLEGYTRHKNSEKAA
jgi:hypothetical protein